MFLVLATAASVLAQGSKPAHSLRSVLDRDIDMIEKQIIDAVEAMPEEKFNFSPESLNIPGAAYKGVRTFAVEIKHIAASNYAIWSGLAGEKFPDDYMGGDGPKNLTTKTEILGFLKDSFALGHRVAAKLTPENMLEPIGRRQTARLDLAQFAIAHAFDHYGQMVEYLRMNGIVPPASRQ
jgi:hypothetical protein